MQEVGLSAEIDEILVYWYLFKWLFYKGIWWFLKWVGIE
jgi:hypothetical protein